MIFFEYGRNGYHWYGKRSCLPCLRVHTLPYLVFGKVSMGLYKHCKDIFAQLAVLGIYFRIICTHTELKMANRLVYLSVQKIHQ